MTQPSSVAMPRLSERKFNVFSDPFVYGYVDDFLPAALYESLESHFPSPNTLSDLQQLHRGKQFRKYWRGDPVDELASVPEPWRQWIDFIYSDRFVDDCGRWSRDFLTPYRKTARDFSVFKLLGNRPAIRNWKVELNCEFSMLPRDALLPPHTDSPDKVLTFMLYFPQDNWSADWGGGTQVYRPLDEKYDSNWSNCFLPRSHTDLVFDCEFRANRLFFFAKSANSWHGVRRLECPSEFLRRSFNFAFVIPRERRRSTSYRFKERLIRKLEKPRFRSFKALDEEK